MKDSSFLLLLSIGWLIAQFIMLGTVGFWAAAGLMNAYLIAHYIVRAIEKLGDKDG